MKPGVQASTLTLLLLACSCGTRDDGGRAGPVVTRETHGDTTLVRTESGSVWGAPARLVEEMSIGQMEGAPEYLFGSIRSFTVASDGTVYVLDRQGPELRAYGADGTYLRTLGRKGEGPGELKQPDGGLALMSDGRIVVRDPGNTRFQVYGPDGAPAGAWSHRGNYMTGRPLWKDADDNLYTQTLLNMGADIRDWQLVLAQVHPDGTPGDTIHPPNVDYEAPTVEARSPDGSSASMDFVPFSPNESYAMHPEGWFVHGISTSYRIELLKPGAPVVIERTAPSVPVAASEKAEAEEGITHHMQRVSPDWRWNGPRTPDTKPAFSDLMVGRDGRIWVQVPQAGVERDDPSYDPKDPNSVEHRWHEPVAFDVFEDDGTYLGQVHTPTGFAAHPYPIFDGDRVWAVLQDDLGVQRIVRFRIEHGPESSEG